MLRMICSVALGFVALSSTCLADYIVTVDTQSYAQSSGIKNLSIFASSNNVANDAAFGMSVDFQITGAGSPSFPSVAGTYGQPGMIGAGNIFGGSSFNNGGVGFPSIANLNLQFNAAQPIPGAPTPLAAFTIDTSTFAPGTYTITPFSAAVDAATPSGQAFTLNGGSFTITAVPEPSSMVMLALPLCAIAFRRRSRLHQAVAA